MPPNSPNQSHARNKEKHRSPLPPPPRDEPNREPDTKHHGNHARRPPGPQSRHVMPQPIDPAPPQPQHADPHEEHLLHVHGAALRRHPQLRRAPLPRRLGLDTFTAYQLVSTRSRKQDASTRLGRTPKRGPFKERKKRTK
ncbi:hypothetical protein BN1723_015800, partial [Verticillium longisporum]